MAWCFPPVPDLLPKHHPSMALTDWSAVVDPNPGIHEQRVGVALAEWPEAVKGVH
jgi:hypothetical protein